MPLTPTTKPPIELPPGHVGVAVQMMDDGKMVVIFASTEALQDCEPDQKPIDAFLQHRERIEEIASAKYDCGEINPDGRVMVGRDDLN